MTAISHKKNSQRVGNDEVRALHGAGNYLLSPKYKKFQVVSHIWLSWNEDRRKVHVKKIHAYTPAPGGSFTIPRNSGRKPGFQQRKRNTREMDIAVDRAENISGTEEHFSSSNIKFSDPCKQAKVGYVLHLHSKLPKVVLRCQGNCGKPINKDDVLLVMSYRKTYWTDKTSGR